MKILRNKKVAKLTTFGIGGIAEYFCEVKNTKELLAAIEFARTKKLKYRIFAGGSNVVFPDGVIHGLLIRIVGGAIKKVGEERVYADAGVSLARLITYAITHGFIGVETLSGIPGTVGGAIVGNAGAYGHSIEESIQRVHVWDGRKEVWIAKNECKFAYRESIFKQKDWIVLGVEFAFYGGSTKNLWATSRRIIAERLKKYPRGLRCPGSYFKNILIKDIPVKALRKIDANKIIGDKLPAGYLLEVVGAKGMRRGGVGVADYHGNLILNYGKGTAKDAKLLAATLKKRVRARFGIELQEEIRYF